MDIQICILVWDNSSSFLKALSKWILCIRENTKQNFWTLYKTQDWFQITGRLAYNVFFYGGIHFFSKFCKYSLPPQDSLCHCSEPCCVVHLHVSYNCNCAENVVGANNPGSAPIQSNLCWVYGMMLHQWNLQHLSCPATTCLQVLLKLNPTYMNIYIILISW